MPKSEGVQPRSRKMLSTLRFLRSAERGARRLAARVVGTAAAGTACLAVQPAQADILQVEILNGLLRADVIFASSEPATGVFLWPDNTSSSQEFDLLDSGDGYFRIRARHSGQCLMLDFGAAAYGNGTKVIQYPYCVAGYAAAEWRIDVLSGTTCSGDLCTTGWDRTLLVNRATGRCLDAANSLGGRPGPQAVLQQWDCVTSVTAWNIGNQSWDILYSER